MSPLTTAVPTAQSSVGRRGGEAVSPAAVAATVTSALHVRFRLKSHCSRSLACRRRFYRAVAKHSYAENGTAVWQSVRPSVTSQHCVKIIRPIKQSRPACCRRPMDSRCPRYNNLNDSHGIQVAKYRPTDGLRKIVKVNIAETIVGKEQCDAVITTISY